MSPRRFLRSLRPDEAPDGKALAGVDHRHSAGPAYAFAGTPYTPMSDLELERVVREHWERDVWVWRACDARAKTAANLDVVVQDARGRKGKPIEGHPLAELLNGQANPYESGFEFRYRLQLLLDLSVSKGVPVEVSEGRGGLVERVDILNPMHTWPVPAERGFIEKWEMRLPDGTVYDTLYPYRKGRGGVLWFKRPHPTDPYQSTSWIRAAGLSIDLDYWARRYNLNFLFHDGRPGGVLAIKAPAGDGYGGEGVTEEDASVLQGSIRGGPENAGRVVIIEADAAEFLDMAQTPRDAQYVEGRAMTQREILIAAGTPLSVIGDASGRTFDNADAEDLSFHRREMKPELRLQANKWDACTTGGLRDTREVVDYDWAAIGLFDREDMAHEAQLRDEVSRGMRTIDDYLEATGREPMNLPGTRVLWYDNGKAPIGSPQDVTALLTQGQQAAPPPGGALDADQPPALPPGAADPAAEDPNIVDAELVDPLDETAYAVKVLAGMTDALADRRRLEHADLIDQWTGRLAEETVKLLGRQEKVVLTRLRGTKARRHTRHWDYGPGGPGGEMKALDPAYVVDRRTWVTQAIELLVDVVKAAFGAAGEATAKALDGPAFDAGAKGNEIVAQTVRLIADGLDARAGRLQDVIAEREAAGDDIDTIAGHVTKAFTSSGTWSEVTSRAVVGAMNAASLISAVRSGAVAKRWLATEDERTRTTHREAEGQVRPVEGKFAVGDAELLFPHDPSGPPSEVINCRCTMIYALGRKTAQQEQDELDADLADLDKAEWKAARIGGFSAATVDFDPTDHPRDWRGRFLDVPDVHLPDGTTGRALSATDAGAVTVEKADGDVVTVDAADLKPAKAPPGPDVPDEPSAARPAKPAADLSLPVEDNPDIGLPRYLLSYLKTVVGGAIHPVEHGSPEEHLAIQQMEGMFLGPERTPRQWQLVRTPDGDLGQLASDPRVAGDVEVIGLPGGTTGRFPLADLEPAGPQPYRTSYDSHAERHVFCSQGHRHWGASGAAGVLVRNVDRDGTVRYLMQLRSPWVQHGNTWSTPGGALHVGEHPEDGGMREATEELGDLPDGTDVADTFTDEHGGWAYHTVVLDSPTRFQTEEGDHEGLRTGWFTAAEIGRLRLHPSFAASWPALSERLGGGDATDPSPHPENAGGRTLAPTFSDQLDEPMAATAAVRAALAENRKSKAGRGSETPVPVGDMNTALATMLARMGVAYDPTAEPSMLAGDLAAKPGETGDGAKARAMIPTVEELLDKGMTVDEARKEWRRLYNNARFRVRDARLKAAKAAGDAVESDKATPAPEVTPQVLDGDDAAAIVDALAPAVGADVDLGPEIGKVKPKALYTLDPEQLAGLKAAGKSTGPGAVSPTGRWWHRAQTLEDGDTVPVHRLWHQGRLIEHGTVFKLTGAPPILIEHGPDEYAGVVSPGGTITHPAHQRANIFRDRWQRAAQGSKADLTGLMTGLTWVTGDNPADSHWAEHYQVDGFKSAATGGAGGMTFWDVEPTVGTIAHEWGHNIDREAARVGQTRLSDPEGASIPLAPDGADPATPIGVHWNTVREADGKTADVWEGYLKDAGTAFQEARLAPGDHPVELGNTEDDGTGTRGVPTGYGRSNASEDFAESVRLYLKDRTLGRLGYLQPTGGETSGPVLRFADMYPERAAYLATVFGDAPVVDTAWRKRQRAEMVKTLVATTKNGTDWQDNPVAADWPTVSELAASFAVPGDVATAARLEAVSTLNEEIADAKKKAAAEQAAAEAKVKAEQEAAAALKAKADAAAAALLAHVETVSTPPAAPTGPADPDAVKKIKKRKAWVKWNAQQSKTTPIPMAGEHYTVEDLKGKDGKGKLLVKPGTLVTFKLPDPDDPALPLTARGTMTYAEVIDGGAVRVDFDEMVGLEVQHPAAGSWHKVGIYSVSTALEGNNGALMLPGTLERVDKAGMSKADAQAVAEQYEAEALAQFGGQVAESKGLAAAPFPEVAGLTDKQVGEIVAGAAQAYQDALADQAVEWDLGSIVAGVLAAGETDPVTYLQDNLVGKTVYASTPLYGNPHPLTVTAAELSPEGDSVDLTLHNTVTGSTFDSVTTALYLWEKVPGSPEQAAAVRQDYIVNAVIQALASPASGTDHQAPSGEFVNAQRAKAATWLHKKADVVHPKAQSQGHPMMQAKANIAAALAERLNNEADWEAFRAYRLAIKSNQQSDYFTTVPHDVPAWKDTTAAVRQKLLDSEVANRVAQWASSSADSNPWAVMMQRAIAEEFATGGDWNPHGWSFSTTISGLSKTYGQAYEQGVGAFYRRVARAMWENTQAEFAEAGITHVSLYRGMKSGYGKSGQWSVLGTHEVTDLMPANSWSSSKSTAKGFSGGGVVLAASFPVSRVLGSARSGYGCWNEWEFVVLNGPGNVTVYNYGSSDIPGPKSA